MLLLKSKNSGGKMKRNTDYSKNAERCINKAIICAEKLGHTYVGSEHLLYSLSEDKNEKICDILNSQGINSEKIYKEILSMIGRGIPTKLGNRYFTPTLTEIIQEARIIAKNDNSDIILTIHLFNAIIQNNNSTARALLSHLDFRSNDAYNKIMKITDIKASRSMIRLSRPSEKNYPYLYQYGKNITDEEHIKKFEPLIGRTNEIEKILRILSRKCKNNACLVGDAGVGKTALVEGISKLISDGKVSDVLRDKWIFSIDLSLILAGAKYRGDFEERIKKCMDEAQKAGNVILFIDEFHNICGAGAAEGAIDAANILKPELARGKIQIIGATTWEEYQRNIEKDKAFARRLQIVKINEPQREECIEIMLGLRKSYQQHHNIIIPENLMPVIYENAKRYYFERNFPDKALDLLDESCSYLRLKNPSKKNLVLQKEDIISVAKQQSGVNDFFFTSPSQQIFDRITTNIKKSVLGHEKQIDKICQVILRSEIGLKSKNKPIGSFFLVGPTGVGKTELCYKIAQEMMGDKDKCYRLDMSEYMEKHSVAKLIGAPAGYVGHEEAGILTQYIIKNPFSVILMDEIEKAHPDVLNLLLQIMDYGTITDSMGRKVSFCNCILFFTSNIGISYTEDSESIGFYKSEGEVFHFNRKKMESFFSKEWLGRIDEILLFKMPDEKNITYIINKLLSELKEKCQEIGINILFDVSVVERLKRTKKLKKFGVRAVYNDIRDIIEIPLSEKMLKNEVIKGDKVLVKWQNKVTVIENIRRSFARLG
jgi:ATP-dependent Clp protease ATP-binding subunit ClpC